MDDVFKSIQYEIKGRQIKRALAHVDRVICLLSSKSAGYRRVQTLCRKSISSGTLRSLSESWLILWLAVNCCLPVFDTYPLLAQFL